MTHLKPASFTSPRMTPNRSNSLTRRLFPNKAASKTAIALAMFLPMAGAAFAGDRVTWTESEVRLTRDGENLVVTFFNGHDFSLLVEPFQLDLDGDVVGGQMQMVPNASAERPDTLIVTPPPGYQCDPCEVTVEEYDTGDVVLTPMGLS